MKDNISKQKSIDLAIRIVNLYKYLCENKKEFVLSKQLLRSGTSIGANLAEAECAISRKDFTAKVYIAYKECSETLYWLLILKETGFLTATEYESIFSDCKSLMKILSKITKTIKDDEPNC